MKIKFIIAALIIGVFTFAQAQEKKQDDGKHEHMEMTTYACSMHPEVKSDKPGDCAKCGMKLAKVEMKKDKMAKSYTCSMHPEIKSDEAGKCPKCGMALVEKKMDMKKEGESDHKH